MRPGKSTLREEAAEWFALMRGFVYVAFVIDAYARRIVGWKVSTSAIAGFVL